MVIERGYTLNSSSKCHVHVVANTMYMYNIT